MSVKCRRCETLVEPENGECPRCQCPIYYARDRKINMPPNSELKAKVIEYLEETTGIKLNGI